MEIINNYTIKIGNKFKYKLPDNTYEYIKRFRKRLLNEFNTTEEQYYKDLNRIPNTPKCKFKECNNDAKFLGIKGGYHEFCSNSCSFKYKWRDPNSTFNSKEFRELKHNEIYNRWNCENSPYRTKEYIKNRSNSFKEREKRLGDNSNLIKYRNIPKRIHKFGNSRSKISLELFDLIKIKLLSLGFSIDDIRYGDNEFPVIYNNDDKLVNLTRNNKYNYIDFYVTSVNRAIEFYGDYWHKNPIYYEESEHCNKWLDDKERLVSISSQLRMRDIPLVIWESDYTNDKEKVLNNCIEYLTKGNNTINEFEYYLVENSVFNDSPEYLLL